MNVLHRTLCALFVLATATAYFIAELPPGARGFPYIVLHFVLTALMLATWGVSRRGADPRVELVAGAAARLLLIGVTPLTSSDVTRYLWDGRAVLSGADPYRTAPELAREIVGDWPLPKTNTVYPTLYPPGALALFSVAAAAGPDDALWVWKAMVAVASCAALVLAWQAMREKSAERHLPLVALSPLLVLEGGVGAHVDLVASLAVAAALLCEARGRARLLGAFIGGAAAIKILPLVLLVPAAGARNHAAALVGVAVVLVVYGCTWFAGFHPIGSLPTFFQTWHFGSPIFELAASIVGDVRARHILLVAAVAGLAVAAARARSQGFLVGAQWALAAPLLASPVVFPWYLASYVPVLALRPSAAGLAWLSAVPFTYEVIDAADGAGAWQPASWPLWVIGVSWIAGGVVDLVWVQRGHKVEPAATPLLRISVIVPVLNEEARIGSQLAALQHVEAVHEVIVVDGGSTDRTVEIVRLHQDVTLLRAPRGRGPQMNAGAAVASGNVLLFLHADVQLPPDAGRCIAAALAEPGVVAGAFRTWTIAEGRRSWVRPFLHLADLRSRYTRLPYGDQALFVRTEIFRQLGGFPDQPLMEDLEFSRRLREVGRIKVVPASVRVSGRRFLARPLYYALVMKLFPLLYRLGAPPELLAKFYGDPR